jgi:hypothetical protein
MHRRVVALSVRDVSVVRIRSLTLRAAKGKDKNKETLFWSKEDDEAAKTRTHTAAKVTKAKADKATSLEARNKKLLAELEALKAEKRATQKRKADKKSKKL